MASELTRLDTRSPDDVRDIVLVMQAAFDDLSTHQGWVVMKLAGTAGFDGVCGDGQHAAGE
jgi:hypothetical protein